MRIDREPNAPEVTLIELGIEAAHREIAWRSRYLPTYQRCYRPLAELWIERIAWLEDWLAKHEVEG